MLFEHQSVMPEKVQKYLALDPGNSCVDCTLGGCGHAAAMAEEVWPNGRFIGIDQDIDAITNANSALKPFESSVSLFHENFSNLLPVLDSLGIEGVDGIVLDLGLSLHQLTQGKRGFSFQRDEPLDMRMDTRSEKTAADIVNTLTEKELADLFFKYGEERLSRRIARAVVNAREEACIDNSRVFADIVRRAVPARVAGKQKIHPATKVFQALRIAVNRELEHLETFMEHLPDCLNRGGRVCVISFHSLEDRIVKHGFRSLENGCTCPGDFPRCVCGFEPKLKSISKKPFFADKGEIDRNPMARSARLRVAERM